MIEDFLCEVSNSLFKGFETGDGQLVQADQFDSTGSIQQITVSSQRLKTASIVGKSIVLPTGESVISFRQISADHEQAGECISTVLKKASNKKSQISATVMFLENTYWRCLKFACWHFNTKTDKWRVKLII